MRGLSVMVFLLVCAGLFGCRHSATDSAENPAPPDHSSDRQPADPRKAAAAPVPAASESETAVSEPGIREKTGSVRTGNTYRTDQPPFETDAAALQKSGIRRLDGRHVVLLTDLPAEAVHDIPGLVDRLYDRLSRDCGSPAEERSGSVFQAVICLMEDPERFRIAGLFPDEARRMKHGRQIGYRAWVRVQDTDYYTRHLVLHEFVHVYMTCDVLLSDPAPRWFAEGVAELYATHQTSESQVRFAVLPSSFKGFDGWGRISSVRRQRRNAEENGAPVQSLPSLAQVMSDQPVTSADGDGYEWWWALAWMLSRHPDYALHWHNMCQGRSGTSVRNSPITVNGPLSGRLAADWLLFADTLCENFDPDRSFCRLAEHRDSPSDTLCVQADRSWQDTGWDIPAGQAVVVECSGRCVLRTTTAPWDAGPDGITLEYHRGQPLGRLLAVFVAPDGISTRFPAGRSAVLTPEFGGRLWLQINDSAASRSDNRGEYTVRIHRP